MSSIVKFFRSRRGIIISVAALLAIGLLVWYNYSRKRDSVDIIVEAEQGPFTVSITVTGELQAVNSVNINAPAEQMRSRRLRLGEIAIKDLVPEGTVVDSGDFVALLDQQALASQIKVTEDEVDKAQQQFVKTQLDTTLQLRDLRNSLINMEFEVEERRLVLGQSQYEPPATIRQAQINLDKAEREYKQAQQNYRLRRRQLSATMQEAEINLQTETRTRDEMVELLQRFTIRAPMHGMVIYYRNWGGEKRKVGSTISAWDPIIATLPDLSEMNSETYVSEVDVSKVATGQKVRIGVDAFPERSYSGVVTHVANIGEESRSGDSRVFEVNIKLDMVDSLVRPSMSTSNEIIISRRDTAVFCPLECVHSEDSVTFVYLANGRRQEVKLGEANDTHVVVLEGLKPRERLYLNVPQRGDAFPLDRLSPGVESAK